MRQMKLIIAALFLISPFAANADIIDFGNVVNNSFDPGESYTEDGFIFNVVSGDNWGLQSNGGNPPSSLFAGTGGPLQIGDTISVTAVSGNLFSFDSFDLAAFDDTFFSDKVDLLGYVGGTLTQSLSNVFSNSASFITIGSMFSGAIDELRIVGSGLADTTSVLDNFVFTEAISVPEPGTLALLGIGLFGMGLARRRKTI